MNFSFPVFFVSHTATNYPNFVAAWDPQKSVIKKLVVTDTIDNEEKVKKASNIQVLTISNLMAEAIKRISNSTSVSDLFK